MGQTPQKNNLLGGVDMDTDETHLRKERTTFQKNLAFDVNKNPAGVGGEGSNYGVLTPYEGNSLLTGVTFPVNGINFCIGTYESKETNEAYVFVWNSEGAHFIYRINGDGTSQMVYEVGLCLDFQRDPQYMISEGRCVLITDTYTDQTGEEKLHKFLIFTDNYNPQRMISVEDSIATNSFNPVQFPFFSPDNPYSCHRCNDLINLGVATPMKCIAIEPLVEDPENLNKQNLLNNKGWQWRIKFIDRFGRESEHGVISDKYFTQIGSTCTNYKDKRRCVELKIDAGCPFVEKIQIEFRTCSGEGIESSDSDWFLYDTLDKYNNCENVDWFERELNPNLNYDFTDNTFQYIFCGDKECQPIPVAQTSRTQNPLPLLSSSVFPIDKGIGLANNVRGFDQLDCSELDKLSFDVTPPVDACGNDIRKIVVYAIIYNPQMVEMSGIYDVSTTSLGPDFEHLKQKGIVFGNASCSGDPSNVTDNSDTNNPITYGQKFQSGFRGFTGFLAGSNYFAISEQYRANASTQALTNIGVLDVNEFFYVYDHPPSGTQDFLIQRFEFKVVPGKYSFRIGGHRNGTDANYQLTSTYTAGRCGVTTPATIDKMEKEIIIDVCNGDYIMNPFTENVLCIYDLSYANEPDCSQWGRIFEGYFREDRVNNRPIELEPFGAGGGGTSVTGSRTDHNGFFFAGGTGTTLSVNFSHNHCTGTAIRSATMYDPENLHVEDIYAMDGQNEYPAAGRREITADFNQCDNPDIGISGVTLVMKYGAFAASDIEGKVTLIAHQRVAPLSVSGDTLIRTQSGGCVLVDCDNECVYCFSDINVPYLPCGGPRNTDLGAFEVAVQIAGLKGLENGGRYGIGIVMHDWMGRHSFVQANESHYVDIPPLTETQVFDFSTITFNMAGILFPRWVKFVSFYLTENLNNEDYLMWVADKVEFIDASGNVNAITPSRVRIYYSSLNEYNKQNNFATNTNWQFLTAENKSVVGDYVEFIRNGDDNETWFDKTTTGLVRYSLEGTYFDVDYSSDLKDLEAGALYKLVRPKACLDKFLYYEVCSTIRVTDGVPETTAGTINGFDSYFVRRQIPVPEQKIGDDGQITVVVTKFYNFYFEHNSPSDFYGFKCANRGRINIKNPYEREKRIGSEVALSQDTTYNGSFNGLSYFIESDITVFDEQEWGAITVVLPEINTFLVLCAHDNFIVGYKDTIARTDSIGQVIAPSSSGGWGTPQRKIGSNYGCQMLDINTIRRNEAIVVFLDSDRYALLFHDFVNVKDITINGFKGFLSTAVTNVNSARLQQIVAYLPYFHGGIDVYKKEYYLTSWYAPASIENPPTYNNNDVFPSPGGNETIAISLETGLLKTFCSFVPEYYGSFEGWPFRKNMFSFVAGRPWSHRGIVGVPVDYNNFYGSQAPKVIQTVANISPETVKKFLYNEVYCKEHKFVITDIITESGQTSRLKATWWERREYFWCAEYLCALNTFNDPNFPILAIAPLTDGDPLSGRWLKSRYVSETADHGKYCELSAIVVYQTVTDKSAV